MSTTEQDHFTINGRASYYVCGSSELFQDLKANEIEIRVVTSNESSAATHLGTVRLEIDNHANVKLENVLYSE